jgi:hypothetical protein
MMGQVPIDDRHPVSRVAQAAVSGGTKLWQQLLIAILLTAIAVVLIDQIVDRKPPVIIDSIRVVPDKPVVGQDVQVLIAMRVLRTCPGTLTRTLASTVDGLAPAQINDQTPIVLTDDGQASTAIRTLHVPAGFSTGPAVYRSEVSFACNAVQHYWPIKVKGQDVPITIEAQAPPEPMTIMPLAVKKPVPRRITRPQVVAQPPASSPLMALFGH